MKEATVTLYLSMDQFERYRSGKDAEGYNKVAYSQEMVQLNVPMSHIESIEHAETKPRFMGEKGYSHHTYIIKNKE